MRSKPAVAVEPFVDWQRFGWRRHSWHSLPNISLFARARPGNDIHRTIGNPWWMHASKARTPFIHRLVNPLCPDEGLLGRLYRPERVAHVPDLLSGITYGNRWPRTDTANQT